MNGKRFIAVCAVLFITVATGYFLLVDSLAIPDRVIGRSYKPFLLKASGALERRVFIDGGSNATHGIDALMIERYFGIFTSNISDNGSYPLEHKILNLGNYLAKNDIVIFSLEWGQYVYGDRLPENYVVSVLDEYGTNSFYYQGLPLLDKIIFVFRHLPYKLAVYRIQRLNGISSQNSKLSRSEAGSLKNFYKFIEKNIRGSSYRNDTENDEEKLTCDEYLMRTTIPAEFRISRRFTRNLRLLQNVARETGARFIFVWPVVVGRHGNECYTSEKVIRNITHYANGIKEEIKKYGFEILGDILDSRFDSTCFLDTNYHIRHDCAVTRTKKLIHQLEGAGLAKNADYSFQETKIVLSAYLDQINLKQKDILLPGSLIEGKDLNQYLSFGSGWLQQGKGNFWSVGRKSSITLKKGSAKIAGIGIKGEYAQSKSKTGVWINGKYMGVFDLRNAILDVKELAVDNDLFKITLAHSTQGSATGMKAPKGNGQMKYRLVAIELIPE